jgi:hypothetical protein
VREGRDSHEDSGPALVTSAAGMVAISDKTLAVHDWGEQLAPWLVNGAETAVVNILARSGFRGVWKRSSREEAGKCSDGFHADVRAPRVSQAGSWTRRHPGRQRPLSRERRSGVLGFSHQTRQGPTSRCFKQTVNLWPEGLLRLRLLRTGAYGNEPARATAGTCCAATRTNERETCTRSSMLGSGPRAR